MNVLRELRGPAMIVAAYVASRWVFGLLTVEDGLLTPGEGLRVGVAVLGVLVLTLRLVVLFVLPFVVAWRLANTYERRGDSRGTR